MANTNPERWLTIKECASLAAVSVRTIQREIAARELRARRRPVPSKDSVRVAASDFETWRQKRYCEIVRPRRIG